MALHIIFVLYNAAHEQIGTYTTALACMHIVADMKHAVSPCYVCVQVMEVGLPGPMDPALIPAGTGPEQAPETAPLLTILTAVLETAQWLKHVQKAVVLVSVSSQLMEACMTLRTTCFHICFCIFVNKCECNCDIIEICMWEDRRHISMLFWTFLSPLKFLTENYNILFFFLFFPPNFLRTSSA